ncbi:hypothetical protein [Actinokineospora cianjurensis]|uniref:hypothetical protein n=1 Tax=Actinokineospora cianjurensis TaxID=585224 RepID=UPI000EADEC1D|nr:hypothetical protein [Actinokineospora cianjurensis]
MPRDSRRRLRAAAATVAAVVAVRLKLEGRVDGNPDQAARTLADGFTKLPGSKRLVRELAALYYGDRTRTLTTLLTNHLVLPVPVDDIATYLSDTAYPADTSHDPWYARRWNTRQARRWLTYLAEHLHREQKRSVSAAQLAHRSDAAAFVAPVLGFLAGGALVLALPGTFDWGRTFRTSGLLADLVPYLPLQAVFLLVVGAVSGWLALGRAAPEQAAATPGRQRVRPIGFWRGMGLACTVGAIFVLTSVVTAVLAPVTDFGTTVGLFGLFGVVAAMAFTVGLDADVAALPRRPNGFGADQTAAVAIGAVPRRRP